MQYQYQQAWCLQELRFIVIFCQYIKSENDMKKIIILTIKELIIPDEGLINGGWYNGMQYNGQTLGKPGEINDDPKKLGVLKKMTMKEKLGLLYKLKYLQVFK